MRGGGPSRSLPFFGCRRLPVVQIGDRALRVGCRREDRSFVVGQHAQPGIEVGGVVRPGFEFGNDAEIGAEEAAPELSSSRARSVRSLL